MCREDKQQPCLWPRTSTVLPSGETGQRRGKAQDHQRYKDPLNNSVYPRILCRGKLGPQKVRRPRDLPEMMEGGYSAEPLARPPCTSLAAQRPCAKALPLAHGRVQTPSQGLLIDVIADTPRISQCVFAGQIIKVRLLSNTVATSHMWLLSS